MFCESPGYMRVLFSIQSVYTMALVPKQMFFLFLTFIVEKVFFFFFFFF